MNRLNNAKKEIIFSELNSLISSGLDFSSAFTLMIESEDDKRIKSMLNSIYQSIISGSTMAQALRDTNSFSALDNGVVAIGEETGELSKALSFLSEYYHSAIAQRRMIVSAVSYPLIIIATAVIVLIFMITVIVPMFQQVYARMGGEMPAITKFIISLSHDFHRYAIILFTAVVSICVVLKIYGENDKIRAVTSSMILKSPMAGMLVKKSTQARFCKLLFLLYSSGVPLIKGIQMLRDIITLYPYQHSFELICKGLEKGDSIAEIMSRFDNIYDRKLIVLIRVGEQTNRLGTMLKKQGEDLTTELEHKLKQVGTMLEPILILFVGVIVAIILIAMYMPMFKIGNIIN